MRFDRESREGPAAGPRETGRSGKGRKKHEGSGGGAGGSDSERGTTLAAKTALGFIGRPERDTPTRPILCPPRDEIIT